MEEKMESDFVAGFGSTNLGDISPNLDGAKVWLNLKLKTLFSQKNI